MKIHDHILLKKRTFSCNKLKIFFELNKKRSWQAFHIDLHAYLSEISFHWKGRGFEYTVYVLTCVFSLFNYNHNKTSGHTFVP